MARSRPCPIDVVDLVALFCVAVGHVWRDPSRPLLMSPPRRFQAPEFSIGKKDFDVSAVLGEGGYGKVTLHAVGGSHPSHRCMRSKVAHVLWRFESSTRVVARLVRPA